MDDWQNGIGSEPGAMRHVHRKLAAHNRIERARELVRLAEADLERQAAAARRAAEGLPPEVVVFDPADRDLLDRVHTDLLEARRAVTTSGRARRRAAERVVALELAERLILARLGCASFEDYQDRLAAASAAEPVIDLAYLEYAHEELDRAEAELAALEADEVERRDAPPLPRRPPAVLPVRFSAVRTLPAPHRP